MFKSVPNSQIVLQVKILTFATRLRANHAHSAVSTVTLEDISRLEIRLKPLVVVEVAGDHLKLGLLVLHHYL